MAQVPSKRYMLFIDYFEKFVTEQQKKIEELRKLEALYLTAKEALEKIEIPNDTKIKHIDNIVTASITLNENNHYKDFEKLRDEITKILATKRLREHSEPSIAKSTWQYAWA